MTNFKKLLLAGTAVVALGATPALATEVADDDTITATDVTGLQETGDSSTITVDSDLGAITLGADATASLTINSAGDTLTVNQTTSGTANGVVYAGDIVETAGDIVLNVTNDDATFQGNIGAIALNAGSSSAAADIDLIFDTANNENLTFAATITAVDANDTVEMFVDDTDGNNNTTTFTGMIGTSSVAIDLIALGSLVDADVDTTFQNSVYATAITLGNSANGDTIAMTVDTATDGTDLTIAGTIDGDDGTDTTELHVVDTDATTADTVTFTGNIGTTNALGLVAVGDVATGGNAVFSGDVTATDIEVGVVGLATGAASADFNGDITGDLNVIASTGAVLDSTANIAGDVDGTITFTDGAGQGTSIVTFDGTSAQTVTGAVTTATNREGVLNVNGSDVTFEAQIGTAGNGLGLFTVDEGAMATLEADLFTDSTTNAAAAGIDVDGTLVLDNTNAGVDVLEDAGDIDVDGTLIVEGTTNNATVVATAGDIFLDGIFTTRIATAGATTMLTSNTATTVGATDNTTMNIGSQVVLGSDMTIGAAGRVNVIQANRSATFDVTDVVDGDDTANAGTLIDANGNDVTVAGGTLVARLGSTTVAYEAGDEIEFIDGAGGGTDFAADITAGDIVFRGTGLIDLQDNGSDTDTLGAVIAYKDANDVFDDRAYAGAANELLSMSPADATGELLSARINLQLADDADAAQDVAESLSPEVDGATSVAGVGIVTDNTLGLTGDRLAALRTGEQTGMAAGNMTHGLKVWGQIFGTAGTQDTRDGIAGYDVDTVGATIGIDTQTLAEDWVWGLAFTYADTEVDSDGVNDTNTDINSYQIALYGDYSWDDQTYVNGTIGYGMNDIDQTRYDVGMTGDNANADYDSDLFFARLETGRDYDMDNGLTLTPMALLNFSYLDTDGYTETGAGTANLSVDTDNQYVFEAGLGLEASWLHQLDNGSYLKPKVRASYRYDFAGDEVETTAEFAGGGSSFATDGFDAQQHTLDVGAGLTFYTTANWDFSANYDYQWKGDYDAHNGYLRAAYKF